MSVQKKDFYGKEVAEAIKNACDSLAVGQEQLDISVIETGSTGIFGLIRKKAHIRVSVKPDAGEDDDMFNVAEILETGTVVSENETAEKPALEEAAPEKRVPEVVAPEIPETVEVPPEPEEIFENDDDDDEDDDEDEDEPESEVIKGSAGKESQQVSTESLEIVKSELLHIVELMGFPSTLEVETSGLSVGLTLRGEYEEDLIGADGKVLDSLQYILRKIASRKVPERLRISINAGDFREKRLEDLKVKAVELAALVKDDGKTQVLPALNPSERRVIHMILQEDKEIRSRSVGDGLFKKILIYKPGKNNRSGGRKRPQGKGRQKKSES